MKSRKDLLKGETDWMSGVCFISLGMFMN